MAANADMREANSAVAELWLSLMEIRDQTLTYWLKDQPGAATDDPRCNRSRIRLEVANHFDATELDRKTSQTRSCRGPYLKRHTIQDALRTMARSEASVCHGAHALAVAFPFRSLRSLPVPDPFSVPLSDRCFLFKRDW